MLKHFIEHSIAHIPINELTHQVFLDLCNSCILSKSQVTYCICFQPSKPIQKKLASNINILTNFPCLMVSNKQLHRHKIFTSILNICRTQQKTSHIPSQFNNDFMYNSICSPSEVQQIKYIVKP